MENYQCNQLLESRFSDFSEVQPQTFDQNDIPLLFFAPDHEKNSAILYEKGKFEIHKRIKLPFGISKGEFYADIYITNPMIEGFVEFNKSLIIRTEGHSTNAGFVFEYSKGHGLLYLQ